MYHFGFDLGVIVSVGDRNHPVVPGPERTGPDRNAQAPRKKILIAQKAQVGTAAFPGARASSPRWGQGPPNFHAGKMPALPGGRRSQGVGVSNLSFVRGQEEN